MVNGLRLLCVTAAIAIASCQDGPCQFPVWWQKLDWFTEYDLTTTTAQWRYKFFLNYVEWTPDVASKSPTTFNCKRQYKYMLPNADGAQTVYYYIWQWGNTQIYTCRAIYETDHALFERNIPIVPADKDIPASECLPRIEKGTVFGNWIARVPINDKVIACPMPEGTYETTYQLRTDTPVQCESNAQSLLTVTPEGTIVMNTCYSGTVSYAYPLKGKTLKCLSMLNGAVLESADNGRIMLLVDTSSSSSQPKYYCVRYKVIDDHKVSMSMDTGDERVCFCKRTQTETSVTDPADKHLNTFIHLTMTNKQKSPLPTCTFEAVWQKKWQYKQIIIGGEYYPLMMEYKGKELIIGPEGSSVPPDVRLSCQDKVKTVMAIGSEYKDVVVSIIKAEGTYSVTENIDMGDFMLFRDLKYTGSPRDDDWKTALGTRSEVEVLVKSPPPTTGKCNITPGKYYTTFKESNTMACEGQIQSHTIITEDSVEFKTCSTSNTYEKPVNTKLKCIGTFREAFIDTDFSKEQGDYLILQWTDPATNKPSYYCAKYKQTPGNVKISLHIPQHRGAVCKASASYEDAVDTPDGKNIAFVVDATFPTTTSTTTTQKASTTTTTTEAPSTTTTTPGVPPSVTPSKTSVTTTASTSTSTTPSPTSKAYVQFELAENPNEAAGGNVDDTTDSFKNQLSSTGEVQNSRVPNLDMERGEMGDPQGTKVSTAILPGTVGETLQKDAAEKICEKLDKEQLKLRNADQKELKYVKGSCKIYYGEGECKSFPCRNNGHCKDMMPSDYECICPMAFHGRNCENVSVTNAPGVDKTAIIVILLVAAIIIFLLVVLFVCICHKNRRRQKEPMMTDELGGHDVARKWAPDYAKDTQQKPA